MKIGLKIAFTFTVLCTIIILLLVSAIYYFANKNAFSDFYTRLELRATIAAKAELDETKDSKTYDTVRYNFLKQLPEEKEFFINTDTLNRVNLKYINPKLPSTFIEEVLQNGVANFKSGYQFFHGKYYSNASGSFIIIVSAINSYAQDFLVNLRKILITACILSMIVVFSIGLLFSNQILQPIRHITKGVKNINATSLHKRLPQKKYNDEIGDLNSTFNEMLSRLETAFETQNNFVSNASHELNTPLTTIIGEADYALRKPRESEEYRTTLSTIMQQSERLRDIIKGLLSLAQSGFTHNFSFGQVSIDEIMFDIQKMAKKVYPQSEVTMDYTLFPEDTSMLVIIGNGHLLELAISNVVLNACKYSNHKVVTVALAVSAFNVVIIVKDNGIGIPQKDLSHIYDPFFRASNTSGIYGYGIGLPLAKNIVTLHKGSIEISSKENEGTEVVIKLPRT